MRPLFLHVLPGLPPPSTEVARERRRSLLHFKNGCVGLPFCPSLSPLPPDLTSVAVSLPDKGLAFLEVQKL